MFFSFLKNSALSPRAGDRGRARGGGGGLPVGVRLSDNLSKWGRLETMNRNNVESI